MRKGELGPLMYLLIGIMVLLAVIVLIIVLKGKSLNIIATIKEAL